MPIKVIKWYTRDSIQAQPDVLWVFGDNLTRTGYGGQARAARGEPNAVGIPTKVSPYQYFSDTDFNKAKPVIDAAFRKLYNHLQSGGIVVWPEDGVGTGLARLEEKAPKIWDYLEQKITGLFDAI